MGWLGGCLGSLELKPPRREIYTQKQPIAEQKNQHHDELGRKRRKPSLKLRASLPLKMDGWNMSFLLGPGPFSGALAVSFRFRGLPIHHLKFEKPETITKGLATCQFLRVDFLMEQKLIMVDPVFTKTHFSKHPL